MAISQTERDLNRFVQEKFTTFLKDVHQSYQIADLGAREMVPCLVATFLKTVAMLAIGYGIPKWDFIRHVVKAYEVAEEAHREEKEKQS